jgi:hypothetical protein
MNTTHALTARRFGTGTALTLMAVGVTLLTAAPAAAQDVDLSVSGPITLPVGWGPVIAGLIVSVLTHLVTMETARPWVRVVIAALLSAVAAIVVQLEASNWSFVPEELLKTFAVIWVWQLLMHFGLVKPLPTPFLAPDKGLA